MGMHLITCVGPFIFTTWTTTLELSSFFLFYFLFILIYYFSEFHESEIWAGLTRHFSIEYQLGLFMWNHRDDLLSSRASLCVAANHSVAQPEPSYRMAAGLHERGRRKGKLLVLLRHVLPEVSKYHSISFYWLEQVTGSAQAKVGIRLFLLVGGAACVYRNRRNCQWADWDTVHHAYPLLGHLFNSPRHTLILPHLESLCCHISSLRSYSLIWTL